jgi:hypothetical protein
MCPTVGLLYHEPMTDIYERRIVHRPQRDAVRYLTAFVAEHRSGDGKVRIALHRPRSIFAVWRSSIERSVTASFYSLQSTSDPHLTYSITWAAKGAGQLPEFAGALAVERLSNADCFGLLLSGHYEPPLGMLGAVFDAVLGRRIAHGSAQSLLRSIAAGIDGAPALAAAPI